MSKDAFKAVDDYVGYVPSSSQHTAGIPAPTNSTASTDSWVVLNDSQAPVRLTYSLAVQRLRRERMRVAVVIYSAGNDHRTTPTLDAELVDYVGRVDMVSGSHVYVH